MFSALMLLLAALNAFVAIWVLRRWQASRLGSLLLLGIVLAGLVYDTALVGLGRFIGIGEVLEQLSGLRFLWLWWTVPLLLIVWATMARQADLFWARHDWVHGAFCLAAVGVLLWHLTLYKALTTLYPACWADTVRYVLSVRPDQLCFADQPGTGVEVMFPWALVLIFLLFLLLGAALWWRTRWPWLFVGVLGGLVIMQLPAGPLAGFIGEALCVWAVALACMRQLRQREAG